MAALKRQLDRSGASHSYLRIDWKTPWLEDCVSKRPIVRVGILTELEDTKGGLCDLIHLVVMSKPLLNN
ncbi:MAG: hypothetical protein HOM65_13870 [Verrucomicrobia bacterium]|nr:hypothetical protein [Verrucomicrobiota bacterium]